MGQNLWEGRHVLVVEDSRVQCDHLVTLLQQFGFAAISCAENGREALWTLERIGQVDLLLTDIDMPEMDGIELLETIVNKGAYEFSIIIMTARGVSIMEAVATMALNSEMNVLGAIEKPVTLELLKRVLEKGPARKIGSHPSLPHMSLEQIREGMDKGQIVPWFQPKVSTRERRMEAVEALARWLHPDYGVLPPAAFICQVEESVLSEPLFFHMLDQSARWLSEWRKLGMELSAAINLPVPLLMNTRLPAQALDVVHGHGITANQITFEVTESMLMSNLTVSLGTLARLRLKGFLLSMDDYGTGYSSPQQLMRCPFTELKIDRAFVHGAAQKANIKAILSSALHVAQQLKIKSVAEGVEDEEDWRIVSELGVDLVQGYYVAKPMPPEQLFDWYCRYRQQ